jgi:arginase
VDVTLILVPYDSARRGERLGAGPLALEAPVRSVLQQRGHRVRTSTIEAPETSWRAEIRTAFDLAAGVSTAVRAAREAKQFPIVLTGNCGAAVGVVAGLGHTPPVLWFDAHGDFNTPETTIGGFLDGMSIATMTGNCWTELAKSVPGFAPVPENRVWLLGVRDLDPLEFLALSNSAVKRFGPGIVGRGTALAIAADFGGQRPYLHIDLDALDPNECRVNCYQAPDGLSVKQLLEFCEGLKSVAPPAALTFSAYDPAVDSDKRGLAAAIRIIETLFE